MRSIRSVWLSIVAGLLLGCGVGDAASAESPAPPVKKLSAKEVTSQIASFKGKVVLVTYWATWCPPCRLEIPGFVSLQSKYGSQGLQIVGLSLDEDPPAKLAAFARKNGMNYPIFIVSDDATRIWGNVETIPMVFLLDAQGNRVWQHEGYASTKEFETQIKLLLPK